MSEPLQSLMLANLLDVFNERDADRRLQAIKRTYTDDVLFSDPDEVVTGHEAVTAKAQQILDGAPGFVFQTSGPVYENHDMGYLAWTFGPEGAPPVVKGIDICFVENGLIAKIYTLLIA